MQCWLTHIKRVSIMLLLQSREVFHNTGAALHNCNWSDRRCDRTDKQGLNATSTEAIFLFLCSRQSVSAGTTTQRTRQKEVNTQMTFLKQEMRSSGDYKSDFASSRSPKVNVLEAFGQVWTEMWVSKPIRPPPFVLQFQTREFTAKIRTAINAIRR